MKNKEILEEALERLESEYDVLGNDFSNGFYEGMLFLKEQDKKLYSEEEVKKILTECTWILKEDKLKWFEKFKK